MVKSIIYTDSGFFKNADWKHFETEFHKQTSLSYSRQPMQSKLSELKRKFVQLVAIKKKLSGVIILLRRFTKERYLLYCFDCY